ncbi:hypothetical protein [Streptomyces cinereoruber]|uniref:hypothetical protein n=1 Tax=Streptomyces cinereoruber TaxID=67260 RepID=UPI0036639EA1
MTDTMPEQTETAPERDTEVSYLEYGPLPEARISLNFTPGKAPQLTVRAHTAGELVAALNELEEGGVYGAIGVAHASMGAQASIGAGLGQTTTMPSPPAQAGPPALPQGAPTPPPFGPNVSVPAAPGYAGPPAPPAPPAQQGGWQQQASPEYRQHGWYKLTVPFPKKSEFDGIVAQYQLRKGRPSEGGQVSWNKQERSWMVSPDAAGAFPQFNPVPA